MATLGWVDYVVFKKTMGFNTRRRRGSIGNFPTAEAEGNFYAQRDVLDMVA